MSQRGRRAIKGILIGLVLIALVVGYYFYLSNRKPKEAAEDTETTVSAVQKLLLKNIDDDYPPTPREVLKLYSDITVCFYSEDYTDEELTQLALQIEKLYDEELIANTSGNKVAALTEVGYNPDVKKLEQSHTPWAYYMTWSKEFCMDGVYNTVEKLKEMYDSDYSVKRTR